MELWKRKEKLGEANSELLMRYDWSWFCTLNMDSKKGCVEAENYLKKWRCIMGTTDHILIAYMGVFNKIPQPHLHLLLWGKRNRFGKNLLDLDPEDWVNAWEKITHYGGLIEPIYSQEGVASYISKQNMPWNNSELITPYPTKRKLHHR